MSETVDSINERLQHAQHTYGHMFRAPDRTGDRRNSRPLSINDAQKFIEQHPEMVAVTGADISFGYPRYTVELDVGDWMPDEEV